MYNTAAETDNRATMINLRSHFGELNNKYRTGTTSLQLLDKNVFYLFGGLRFKPFNILFKNLNEKTSRLFEAGFSNYWITYVKEMRTDKIGPEVLTMDHIGIGFITCLIPLAIAFVVFLTELVSVPTQKLLKFIIDSLVARSIIETFMLSVVKY